MERWSLSLAPSLLSMSSRALVATHFMSISVSRISSDFLSYGEGFLILKGYGKILKMNIDNDKPLLIEDASLIAMEEKINFSTVDVKISDELKEYLKSGVEAPYSIAGNGSIWLQTKGKYSIEE